MKRIIMDVESCTQCGYFRGKPELTHPQYCAYFQVTATNGGLLMELNPDYANGDKPDYQHPPAIHPDCPFEDVPE